MKRFTWAKLEVGHLSDDGGPRWHEARYQVFLLNGQESSVGLFKVARAKKYMNAKATPAKIIQLATVPRSPLPAVKPRSRIENALQRLKPK